MGWTLLIAVVYFVYGAIFAVGFGRVSTRPWLARWSIALAIFFLWPAAVVLMGFVVAGACGRIVGDYFSRF
ncbi:hypothetical protein BAJUN_00920 [Bajunvirus bajun]|uniref:Uncharacterized protein n=1 Tax=Brevundimonas phage vB_BgoS-Bajun TaxID=2948594 RepID=A0A9E7SUS4_9CAUD|nr:hypothetical protein BAJUN_00920 [Brevundimonas phage vB_BgoS-Bajun]